MARSVNRTQSLQHPWPLPTLNSLQDQHNVFDDEPFQVQLLRCEGITAVRRQSGVVLMANGLVAQLSRYSTGGVLLRPLKIEC